VSSKDTVPSFGPDIPGATVFEKDQSFREFLFCKIVNGERAAYKSPAFVNFDTRTRGEQLITLSKEFVSEEMKD